MKSIVVLDDNAGVREGVAKVLRDGGYRPLAASDDGEALRAVTEHEPAAVIVDLLMSGIDGRGFLDRLARLDPERGIPVISHTAICEIGDLLEVTREWGKVW